MENHFCSQHIRISVTLGKTHAGFMKCPALNTFSRQDTCDLCSSAGFMLSYMAGEEAAVCCLW